MIDLNDACLRDAIIRRGPQELLQDKTLLEAFVKEQLLALSAATPEKQEIAVKRLLALDAYLASARSRADLDHTIGAIGGGQSNVYRLLKRIGEFGPITGLLKGTLKEPRASVVREGFGTKLDTWIADLLAEDAEMKIAEVARRLRDLIAGEGASDVTMPHAAALKRRIHMLRLEREGAMTKEVAIGGNLLIDQVLLNVRLTGNSEDKQKLCAAVFVVDRNSSLILGFGVYTGDDPRSGFEALAESVITQLSRLLEEDLRFADHLDRIRWIMTSAMTKYRNALRHQAMMLHLSKELVFVVREQASGRDLSRLVGPGIPPFAFRQRSKPDDMAAETSERSQLVEPGEIALPTLPEVEWRLDLAVVQRNAKVIEGVRAARKDAADGRFERRNDEVNAANIASEIRLLLEPLIDHRPGQVARGDSSG